MISSDIYSLFLLGNLAFVIYVCCLLKMVCTSSYEKYADRSDTRRDRITYEGHSLKSLLN
jgi:hypothetical protein